MWYFVAGFAAAALLAVPLVVAVRVRMRQNQQLERRARESESLALLGTLARGLAHEIRNPLSTMRVNLQLMQEDWSVTSTPREERTLRKVEVLQQETQRLEETLNDFLRYARGHRLNLTRVNINDVLSDLITFFEPQAQQHQVKLRRQLAEGLPPCHVDVDLIKQAILNLMINAQQAMPQGGELIITTRADRGEVLIDVIDTGVGIEPAIREQIFQAYFSAKHSGTGLGLALTKRIIEEHHGRIEVTSEPGKGSDFRVILPAARDESDPGDQESEVAVEDRASRSDA